MKKVMLVASLCAALAFNPTARSAAVGSDGGITLYITCVGSLATDMVVDLNGNPVNNPATGTQWNARDKFEHDIRLFAEHLYQMTEGKHYLRHVLVSDGDRSFANADIRWSNFAGLSTGSLGGWDNPGYQIVLRRAFRSNIHEVVSHEFGHYFYTLQDEYLTPTDRPDYYQGYFSGTAAFRVTVSGDCTHTVMNSNNPYQFCDSGEHQLTVSYTNPTTSTAVNDQVLTPALLTDADASNDGPISSWIDHPYAMDGWTVAAINHTDLAGHHTVGSHPVPNFGTMPAVNIEYVAQDAAAPGRILLLDRSGSMAAESFGIKASQYVQEAGLYLYHSSEATDQIGAYVYNASTDPLFAYGLYNNANTLVSFYDPQGLTNIHLAIKTGLDALVAAHGEAHVAGAELFLMSDGQQTTGPSLWTQVDRAHDLGVRIHTFAYGDSDQAVMNQISSDTSGEEFIMSENSGNLMNLKLAVIKALSRTRGWTLVHSAYGTLEKTGTLNGVDIKTVQFGIPAGAKDLKFYVLPEQPEQNNYGFDMKHATSGQGASTVTTSIQTKGRFKGQGIKHPADGSWTVTIKGDPKTQRLPVGKVQLLAYVDNAELKAQVWMDRAIVTYGKNATTKLYARIANQYPLTRVKTKAVLRAPSGSVVQTVSIRDDGRAPDAIADDGIYTGRIVLEKLPIDKIGRFTAAAHFDVTVDSVPAPNAEYESREDYALALKSFKPSAFSADAETALAVKRAAAEPAIRSRDLAKKVVATGKSYDGSFLLTNAFPSATVLRVNLGQGIIIKGVQADRPKGTYKIAFNVTKKAKPGSRDLSVQFGKTILTLPTAIVVKGRIQEITPAHGIIPTRKTDTKQPQK